jgi:Cdc6-like AAA superfamily ATPase
MAMKVTKRAELIARMKREEAERRAIRNAEAFIKADTLEAVVVDLFDHNKALIKACIFYTGQSRETAIEAYDGLEEMRIRLANQGISVEWRDILPEEFKDLYGGME